MARWHSYALVFLVACHTDPSRPAAAGPRPPDGGSVATVPATDPGHPAAARPAPAVTRHHGAAHYAQITQVAVASDGTAAITRDNLGGLRLWPTLDGTEEPRIINLSGAVDFSIERRADGLLAAIVDGSSGGHLLAMGKDGRLTETGLPIDPGIQSLTVIPGGDRVLGVGVDHQLWMFDAGGQPQGSLAVRSAQIAAALVSRGGAIHALLRTSVKGKPGLALAAISAAKGLAESGRVALPIALAPQGAVIAALSPSGARIAYLGQDAAGGSVRLVVADAATGAEIAIPDAPAIQTPQQTALGWTADDALQIASTTGGWRIAFGATAEVFGVAQSARQTVPAFGGDAMIAGYGAHLAIQRGDQSLKFLGYAEMAPTAVSISPSGESIMWITQAGALVRETIDGSRPDVQVRINGEWHGSVVAIDDHTALAGRNSGVIALLDMDSGKELATMAVSSSTPIVQYSAARKLAAVMAQNGVVWLIPVDRAAAEKLGKPIVVADGAQSFALLDGGDAALMTYDASWKGRTYTLAQLQKGVSASEMKKERWGGAVQSYIHDRAGRSYVVNGAAIDIYRQGVKEKSVAIEAASAVAVSPDGRHLAVTTQAGSIAVYDPSGTRLFSVAAGTFAYGMSWSDDGHLLAVATQGGGLVVDADSGTQRLESCGWKFTLDNQVPSQFPQNVPTVCR
ncbi:MAG: lactonase family protein [Deltaproteobacteria bacterium]|nr:lactonase family protein [Deltaproteobacteria bacterium]